MSKKEKKDKVIYYDDNSTIADMTNVTRTGLPNKKPREQKQRATFKEKWKTYWHAVKMMLWPMCFVLAVLGLLYLLMMLIFS